MSRTPGQTLFLGASVVSYNASMGWGSSPSTLQVELIEDFQPHRFFNIAHHNTENTYLDNHYYNCSGDDCYVDELGRRYGNSPTKKEKNVPGKIYYGWVNNQFVSKYWYLEDPGFFATGTKVQPDGSIPNNAGRNGAALNTTRGLYTYDIINTPVYFKFDDFEFIGLVKNWERNNRPGGITYTVTIESFSNLLDNCWIILDKYGGSIFGKVGTSLSKGTPVNNVGAFTHTGQLVEGNIPNIFNVYGFLESFGIDFFGGGNYNDQGLRAIDVLQGLSALTSSHNRLDRDVAFSPFGRILTKTIAQTDGNIVTNIHNFGIISPNIGTQRFPVSNAPPTNYNSFSLDLSDIGNILLDYRISGSKSISDLLRTVSDASGTDYTIKVIPAIVNNRVYQFVIKVISVDRTSYRSPYNIRSIITNLENNQFKISNSSFGQETNDNVTNKFIIGGPQQRLLQVKNYRLSYTQTNYVYNPILKRFVSLNKPWNKARVPDVMSTRHPAISNLSLGTYIGNRININDTERNTRFLTTDSNWRDQDVNFRANSEEIVKGNYRNSSLFSNVFHSRIVTTNNLNPDVRSIQPKQCDTVLDDDWDISTQEMDTTCFYYPTTNGQIPKCPLIPIGSPKCDDRPGEPGNRDYLVDTTPDPVPDLQDGGFVPVTGYDQPASRYLNLQNDWICPYFGRALEQKMPVADDTNEYRAVRPVFLDIWTNQIVVAFNMHELPTLSIGEPLSLYDQTIYNTGTFFSDATGGLNRGGSVEANGRGTTTTQRNGQHLPNTSANPNGWDPVGDPRRTMVYRRPGFTITESEMRAALVSFDSYFAYCLGKSNFSKPDLFLMLLAAYKTSGQLIANIDGDYFGDINLDDKGLIRGAPGDIRGRTVVFNNIPTMPESIVKTNLNMNWNLLLNHNFIKDLQIIYEFIKNIADTYYGKQYLVKLPDIILYKDRQYANIRIPAAFSNISVYTGSSKTFANYELADGAWEEPGNFIDDCIVVGDNFSKVFADDNNLIGPIVGYNNSLNRDDVREQWCLQDLDLRIKALYNNLDPADAANANSIFSALEGLQDQINGILLSGGGPPLINGEIDNAQWEQISVRINRLIDRFKNGNSLKALKELQKFGHTINCVTAASMINIHEQWNVMWSSISNSVNNANLGNLQYSMTRLADQWKKIINRAEESSRDLQLLKFGVPSLDISSLSGADDFVIVPVSSKKEPFGRQSPRSSKLFKKCSKERIVFMNLTNFTDPRAVMVLDGKLDVFSSSLAYSKDPGISVISNIAIEDSALYIRLQNQLRRARVERNDSLERGDDNKADEILTSINILKKEVDYIRMLKYYIVPEIDPRYLVVTGPTANPTVSHALMSPRAAHPSFFAVPLKSNQFCYGPWTNYADNIVPFPYINNLVHKTSVEQVDDLVPWNYGSSSALDMAVGYRLNADINYQTVLENGTISIIGPPLFGLGGVFNDSTNRILGPGNFKFDNGRYRSLYAPYAFADAKRNGYRTVTYDCIKLVHKEVSTDGPLISNLSIQAGSDGVVTSYRFQTYNPKTGLYSKNYEDALRQMSVDRNKFQKAISDMQKSLSNRLILDNINILKKAQEGRSPASVSKYRTSLYGQSPIEIFVGQGLEVLKNPVWYSNLRNYTIQDRGDFPLPSGTSDEDRMRFLNQKRQYSWVGGVMGIEIGAELQQEYNNKSAMSLDGLLSPVSFYPTKANRTYNMSTYVAGSGVPVGRVSLDNPTIGTTCPYCYNKRIIKIPFVDYNENANTYDSARVQPDQPIACPVCSRAKIDIVKNDKNPDREMGLPDINIYSLNPVVVSEGEFRNPYANNLDRCRHSISVVGRGEYNPVEESLYSPNNINAYRLGRNPDYSKFDTKVAELENLSVLLNQRFMALRGPLMLHGWGFDTEGYPVPNALDMTYKIDNKARPLRFQLVNDLMDKKFGQNDLTKPGKYLPGSSDDAPLGDIITQRYEWRGSGTGVDSGTGQWVKKAKPSKKFYLNWAERQDLWPVGPIDLRWDANRRVWDAGGGCKEEIMPPFIISNATDNRNLKEFLESNTQNKCPYKMIYITLEQDMIKDSDFEITHPARGFIDDIEYTKEPLSNNYRRLVYVVDTAGYTAPKGAKLLCRYNRDNGFYEPITKPIMTALGTINGGQARIELSYVQGRRSGNIPVYAAAFANPLNLRVGQKGLFNYVNGQWILVSTG